MRLRRKTEIVPKFRTNRGFGSLFFLNVDLLRMVKLKYIILFLITAVSAELMPQLRTQIEQQSRNEDMTRRNIERQINYAASLESRGNYDMSFNVYNRLALNYPRDLSVIRGLVEISLKADKIRQCETFLINTLRNDPVPENFTDPSDETAVFPFKVAAVTAEFFFRTSRNRQAYYYLDMIRNAKTDEYFKQELTASVFLNSGQYDSAEKIYKELRTKAGDELAFAPELYEIYLKGDRKQKLSDELIRMVLASEEREISLRSGSITSPEAVLFNLFEDSSYKDSILISAQNIAPNTVLLAEIYFNLQLYDRSYRTLLASGSHNREKAAYDMALRLFVQNDHVAAGGFFDIASNSSSFRNDHDFVVFYSLNFAKISDFEKAEELIMSSTVQDRQLLLAGLYHNYMGRLKEADSLYTNFIGRERKHLSYSTDQILLKIALGEYEQAADIALGLTNNRLVFVSDGQAYYEVRFLETVADLLMGKEDVFHRKARVQLMNGVPSDRDNDLIRIVKDLKQIGDDEDLKEIYKKIVKHRINPAFVPEIDHFECRSYGREALNVMCSEIAVYYYSIKNDTEKIEQILIEMTDDGLLTNTAVKTYLDHISANPNSKNTEDILFRILKSNVDEPIKSIVRETLRRTELS